MGGGSWSSGAWQNYASQNVQGKTRSQVFSSARLNEAVDPHKFTNGLRESVDSPDNPNSTPVAIFTDCTGSMGALAEVVVRKLDTVCEELLARSPVSDVHLMTGVVGDAYTDSAPFQATQFEADIRIAQQTQLLWLEGNGGGNGGESYALPWLSMAMQTATDSFDKRGKKGYLFTVGDEGIHGVEGARGHEFGVTKEQAERVLGLTIERDLTAAEILALVEQRWNVYHVVIETGRRADIESSWVKLMPDRLLYLEANNIELLPELIVSTIEFNEGKDKAAVAASWSGATSVVVSNAMRDLATRSAPNAAAGEVIAL